MKKFINSNLWLISAVLYPLSWVTYSGPNLSFLSWIAFVPLLVFLNQNRDNWKKFYGASLAVIISWAFVSSAWVFQFPAPTWQSAFMIGLEILHISIPFLILFFIQKKIGFTKAILLLPFIWVVWEWTYLPMQHTMGSHLLSYSQGNNIWLIQAADIGGMWLISFWVMLFNVVGYLALQSCDFKFSSRKFAVLSAKSATVMIVPMLLYFMYAHEKWSGASEKSLQVSIIPTQFEPEALMNDSQQKSVIENTLHRTDSLAYDLTSAKRGSDLYVWPEAGTSHWLAFDNITQLLHEAVTDWSGSLLTGCKGITLEGDDKNAYVSAVMVSPSEFNEDMPLQYHHKTKLTPGAETLPYKEWSAPLLSGDENVNPYFTPGSSYEPLALKTKSGASFSPGISLCYEQWFPAVWSNQANKGAEFFVHMAAEGWYGDVGYSQFMANVSRFRAIENRRTVVRSSNKGLSMFINPMGHSYGAVAYGSLDMSTASVSANSELTVFSQYPNLFPISCLWISIFYLVGLYLYGVFIKDNHVNNILHSSLAVNIRTII